MGRIRAQALKTLQIIFDHFELILDEWKRWQENRDAE